MLQVIKSARVMKKAVGYLIPFMEKEREDMMSESSQDLVSLFYLWGNVAKIKEPLVVVSVFPEFLRDGAGC